MDNIDEWVAWRQANKKTKQQCPFIVKKGQGRTPN